MNESDADLLQAYVKGEASAFDRLAQRHAGWIYGAARRRLRDDHLADDVTQAVLLLLAEKSSELLGANRSAISAWLFRVMHFACLRARRTRSRQSRNELQAGIWAQDTRATETSAQDALRLLLEESIAELSVVDREAVVKRFYQGADLASIGDALALSADAARKRISRALLILRATLLRDGVDLIPDALLEGINLHPFDAAPIARAVQKKRIHSLAKGAMTMAEQNQAVDFPVMTAELFVKDVESSLDFFEKLGFRRRWTETPDAMGRLTRASLVGGVARIWLRRAAEVDQTKPAPGVALFFWIEGGADGLTQHRARIAGHGVAVSPFFDDHTLRNFTVTTPDGYTIGFFTQYQSG